MLTREPSLVKELLSEWIITETGPDTLLNYFSNVYTCASHNIIWSFISQAQTGSV